ncbi:MAG: WG repeat-containing protein [Clostridia bacterium]|nr:WG repeat-containing protein [Clostridia bacterium]
MKLKSVIVIFLCIITLLSTTSCSLIKDITKETTGQEQPRESEVPLEEEQEPAGYTVISEALFTEGDIQPFFSVIYDEMIILAVNEYTVNGEKFLVDYEGNKLVNVSDVDSYSGDYKDPYVYCDVCNEYNTGSTAIDPTNFNVISYYGGHGGPIGYTVIDEDTGLKYIVVADAYPETEWEDCDILPLGKRRDLTEDEQTYSSSDYTYDPIGEYVLLIGDRIAVRDGFDFGIKFDSYGITALSKDGNWGYYNSKGENILPHEYSTSTHYIHDYWTDTLHYIPYSSSFGYIALNKDGMWGYADTEGNMITDFIFEEARPVYMGMAWVKMNGAWSVISLGEYDEGISQEEAYALLKEEYPIENYVCTYLPDKDDTYYKTRSYCYKVEYTDYDITHLVWVMYNGRVCAPVSVNNKYY